MRKDLYAGLSLAVAGFLLVCIGKWLDLELSALALLGVAGGAVVALVPDRSAGLRLLGFVVGFAISWIGYFVRAGLLPDTDYGRAVYVGLVLALAMLAAIVAFARLPFWSVLVGVATFAGGFEATYNCCATAGAEQLDQHRHHAAAHHRGRLHGGRMGRSGARGRNRARYRARHHRRRAHPHQGRRLGRPRLDDGPQPMRHHAAMHRPTRTLTKFAAIGGGTAMIVAAGAFPAVAAEDDGDGDVQVVNTETVQAYTDATGEVQSKRLYEQLALTGTGPVDLANPVELSGLRNLDGFSGLSTEDGNQLVDVDVDGQENFRSVSNYEEDLPLQVSVEYVLDGEPISPKSLVGESGELEVVYTVQNVTNQPQTITYTDGKGGTVEETADVMVPMVGSLDTTLPSNFREVEGNGANLAGDGEGGTRLSWTMTLLAPLGADTVQLGYTAQVKDAVAPGASITALPVNPLDNPTLSSAASSYKGGADTGEELADGASQIDSNLLKLRDGAADLLAGLIKLRNGADQLEDGLKNEAAPGAKKLANGAGDLNDGLGDLEDGAGRLADGTGDLRNGVGDLSDGAGKLNDGAGRLSDGASRPRLADGAGRRPQADRRRARQLAGTEGLALRLTASTNCRPVAAPVARSSPAYPDCSSVRLTRRSGSPAAPGIRSGVQRQDTGSSGD